MKIQQETNWINTFVQEDRTEVEVARIITNTPQWKKRSKTFVFCVCESLSGSF